MLFTYLIKVLLLFLENKFIKHFDWTELMLDFLSKTKKSSSWSIIDQKTVMVNHWKMESAFQSQTLTLFLYLSLFCHCIYIFNILTFTYTTWKKHYTITFIHFCILFQNIVHWNTTETVLLTYLKLIDGAIFLLYPTFYY